MSRVLILRISYDVGGAIHHGDRPITVQNSDINRSPHLRSKFNEIYNRFFSGDIKLFARLKLNFVFLIALSLICNRPKFRLSHQMTKCTKRTNVPEVPNVPKMYQNHNESRGDVSYGCCWFLISSMMEFPTRLLFIPVSLLTLITK